MSIESDLKFATDLKNRGYSMEQIIDEFSRKELFHVAVVVVLKIVEVEDVKEIRKKVYAHPYYAPFIDGDNPFDGKNPFNNWFSE